nr:WSSV002 [White spot syndrome virus]
MAGYREYTVETGCNKCSTSGGQVSTFLGSSHPFIIVKPPHPR